MLTPQQFREKQARRLKGAMEDMRLGVNNVTEAPTAKAAQKQEKMLANLTQAVNDGKWKRGLLSVSNEDWKEKMLNKGLPRVAAGIDAAAAKVEDFASKALPYIAAGQAQVDKMPDLTLEDNIARSNAMIRHMSKFQK